MGIRTSKQRISDIIEYALAHGNEQACADFNITAETLARYKRVNAEQDDDTAKKRNRSIEKILTNYSDAELKVLANGARVVPCKSKVNVSFSGEKITFGYCTDTHIGSVYFIPDNFKKMLDEFDREKCSFIAHTGDVSEGMSGRPGHYYELTHIGFHKQRDFAVEIMRQWEKPWFLISGNHDRWFHKAVGADIVADVARQLPSARFLGHDEGDIILNGGITIKLWHGEDGSSYAHSYRPQKIIESFTGGEKPNVLLSGHVHKSLYFMDRHIHVFSGGAMSKQSKWMRGKRLPNHYGFWIINLWLNESGVAKCRGCWYPFYE